jgi:flagellar hook-length control protein FliK
MPDETVSSHSTAELVNKKQVKSPQEQPTANLQSPLSALLHGDKTLSSQTQITDTKKDSKIETKTDTKIKANSTILSQLLHGENQQTTQTATQTTSEVNVSEISSTAGNSLHVKQTEADLTVKMNEAKQMVKYLAQDIKQAIEDYKPPFTRIKVKLNPQKFGEVDLTVVQRGKNVHVNISSNSAAINMLSQNSGDLKTQLTQNGMNNASVNFNSSSDSQGQQQQQNGHQKESAKKAYEAFTQDETNEEILSSLEIVVPRYI